MNTSAFFEQSNPDPLPTARGRADSGIRPGAWIAFACAGASLAPLALYLVPGITDALVMAIYGGLAVVAYAAFFVAAIVRSLRAALATTRHRPRTQPPVRAIGAH